MPARHALAASVAASMVLLGFTTASAAVEIPAAGQAIRSGGDREVVAARRGGDWVCGTAAITTPLPVGYPAPTPPGAIDLKTYPSLRRAEVTSQTSHANLGMNLAFFPLFNHIKRRDIAMTSPVEMDYAGMSISGETPPVAAPKPQLKAMTMSFLYRSPELGPLGGDSQDAKVRVVDTAPATYLSLGLQGGYGLDRVQEGMEQLQAWLAANTRWEAVGDVRALHYNGPERRDRDKWLEVQVQVRPRETD
jgi:hypothetical protein